MSDKLKYIPIDDSQNYPFTKLKLLVETFEYSTRSDKSKFNLVPKVVKSTNKKTLL